MNLMGLHFNRSQGGMVEKVMEYDIRTVVSLDYAPWQWATEQGVITFARFFQQPHPDFDNMPNPWEQGYYYGKWQVLMLGGLKPSYVIGLNEPTPGSPRAMYNFGRFERGRIDALRQHNLKAAIGSFSVGNPPRMSLWRNFQHAMVHGNRHGAVLALHEYGPPPNIRIDSPWLILRHRKVYHGEPAEDWGGLKKSAWMPLFITETGMDNLIYYNQARGYERFVSPEEYIDQLAWLNSEWERSRSEFDIPLVGGTVYCALAEAFPWYSYDVWPIIDKLGVAMREW